jgi:hypothetical protein
VLLLGYLNDGDNFGIEFVDISPRLKKKHVWQGFGSLDGRPGKLLKIASCRAFHVHKLLQEQNEKFVFDKKENIGSSETYDAFDGVFISSSIN